MRLELNDENKIVDPSLDNVKKGEDEQEGFDTLNEAVRAKERAKFRELDRRGKIQFIWDYYKWFFIVGIVLIFAARAFIRDYRENLKPVYLDAVIINSNFAYDNTNTLESDYVSQIGFDTNEYNYYIDLGVNLSVDSFDTMMIASQQKMVSMYQAGELDVVMGPVDIMEGPADCESYGDLSEILPQDLIDELKDREYEFYYYDAKKIAKEQMENDPEYANLHGEEEYVAPYFAGVYLDNCSYLNNNGEYGAYDLTTDEKKRPIFTIAVNAPHKDHAIEFLRFLIENK